MLAENTRPFPKLREARELTRLRAGTQAQPKMEGKRSEINHEERPEENAALSKLSQ